jgi:DNA topoisomerase-1
MTWKATWNPKNWLEEGQSHFQDKKTAERIAAIADLTVTGQETAQTKKAPPPPFTTSTLQQAASNVLKMDPKKTMQVAQRLYEAGLITYMRTDSQAISEEAVGDIRKIAQERNWPLPESPRAFKSLKGAQEAHEAIRPTHASQCQAGSIPEERALYGLIWRRAMASQLSDAIYSKVEATLTGSLDGKEVVFEAKGSQLLDPGWKVAMTVEPRPSKPVAHFTVDGRGESLGGQGRQAKGPGAKKLALAEDQTDESSQDKDQEELNNPVPRLSKGQGIRPLFGEVKTKKTVAPPRYTQAALIRELEKRGIGRPSTYAAILDNIVSRQYIATNKKRQLEATPLGFELISFLKPKFGFADYEYTKLMEAKLDDVAAGSLGYLALVKPAYESLREELKSFGREHGHSCENCGHLLKRIVKAGPNGYNFWACENRSECGAKYKDQNGRPGLRMGRSELTDHKCPDCGQPLSHLIKEGAGGYNFWACSDRVNCGAVFKNDDGWPGEKRVRSDQTDHKCPDCGLHLYHLVKEGDDGYDFWACSDRVNCRAKFKDAGGTPGEKIVKIPLTDQACPVCGQPLYHIKKEGPGGYDFWACSNRAACGAKFQDNDGAPGERAARTQLTDHMCPDCGQPLSHIVKEGANGYNFWACSNRLVCGAKFQDNDGSPGEKNQVGDLTDRLCPDCGQALYHIKKEGPGGYDFWACSNRAACGAKFQDNGGSPGEKTAKTQLTDHKCPDCGQPLRHIVKEGEGGYDFWACSNRDSCGAKFKDDGGLPGEKSGKSSLTSHECPDCGQPLRHIVKAGEGGYDFWACSNRDSCGAKFQDKDGSPGEKSGKSTLTDLKCPDCGQPLQHIVKEGQGGYNFWACSNKGSCGAKFQDQDGQPGEKNAKTELTNHICQVCGQRLKHIVKDGPSGYNFWGCSDRACGATYRDEEGSPGPQNPPRVPVAPSDFKCPVCQSPLFHRKGLSRRTNEDYDFFACSNRACNATYQTKEDKPIFLATAETAPLPQDI